MQIENLIMQYKPTMLLVEHDIRFQEKSPVRRPPLRSDEVKWISGVGKTFHELLFEQIQRRRMTDVEVYRRANLDRKLFSKIRSNLAYHPGKNTVLALAIALKPDLQETEELLASAEYALSPASKSDLVVRYFIEHEMYDIHGINIALYDHGLMPLEPKG